MTDTQIQHTPHRPAIPFIEIDLHGMIPISVFLQLRIVRRSFSNSYSVPEDFHVSDNLVFSVGLLVYVGEYVQNGVPMSGEPYSGLNHLTFTVEEGDCHGVAFVVKRVPRCRDQCTFLSVFNNLMALRLLPGLETSQKKYKNAI